MLSKTLGPPGEAKLVKPLVLPAPANPPKPDPKPPNADPPVEAEANGDGPSAAAKPLPAGLSDLSSAGLLKTEVLVPPMELKGDCSEPEKAAKLDDANAEDEVVFSLL